MGAPLRLLACVMQEIKQTITRSIIMGTRCNIRITYGDNDIYIYRHWDGYLSATGKDVYDKLQSSTIDKYSFGDETNAVRVNIVNFIIFTYTHWNNNGNFFFFCNF